MHGSSDFGVASCTEQRPHCCVGDAEEDQRVFNIDVVDRSDRIADVERELGTGERQWTDMPRQLIVGMIVSSQEGLSTSRSALLRRELTITTHDVTTTQFGYMEVQLTEQAMLAASVAPISNAPDGLRRNFRCSGQRAELANLRGSYR